MPQQSQIDMAQELWRRHQADPAILSDTQVIYLEELRRRWGLSEPPPAVPGLRPITKEMQFEAEVPPGAPEYRPLGLHEAQRVGLPIIGRDTPIDRFSEKVMEFVAGDPESDLEPGTFAPGGRHTARVRKFLRQAAALPWAATVGFANELVKSPIGAIAGIPEHIAKALNNFAIQQSPYSTPEQLEQVEKSLDEDPGQYAFAVLMAYGVMKPLSAKTKIERATKEALAEAPRIAEKPPVRPVEPIKPEIRPKVPVDVVAPVEVPTTLRPGLREGVPVALEVPVERPAVAPRPRPVAEPITPRPPVAPPEVPLETVPALRGGVQVAIEQPVGVRGSDVLGLNLEGNARLRLAAELRELPPDVVRGFKATVDQAKAEGKSASALETANEVLVSKRPITGTEHVGMVIKAIDLKKEYNAAIKENSALLDAGDIAGADIARTRANIIMDNIDRLTEGTKSGRREAARTLGIGRIMLDMETYDIASVTQRAQASKGKRLSPKETEKIEKIVAEHSVLQDQLKQAEVAYEQLLVERDRLAAENITRVETGKQRIKSTKAIENILAERGDLKTQLADMGYRVNDITGVTAEGAYLVGKLAVNYIKEGVRTLPDVVARVQRDIPVLTERDVYKSIIAKDPKRQAQARTETTKRIADLKTQADLLLKIEKAEEGVFDLPKGKTPRVAEVRVLQKRLTDLRSQAYKSGMHPSRMEQAFKTINELQDQLANYYRPIRQKTPIETQDLASAKVKIRDLRRELAVENDLMNLNEQLRTGDFVIKEPIPPREIPLSLEQKQIALKRARRQIRVAIDEMAPWTGRKVTAEVINTLRTLKATADMSATLRQGLVLSVRRPIMATKAFGKSFKAFFRENAAERVDNAIRSAPHHYLREKSGLQLTEVDAMLTGREEMFGARLIERVPVIGEVVKASNRHMVTHLNLLRTSVFDEFLAKYPNATHAELTAWADWINVASGRGDIGRLAVVANEMSWVVFAPRFAWSRVQTPFRVFKHWKQPRVRAEIAKDMVALTSMGTMALVLADLAGAEVGLDPHNPDFGKIRIGDTRIDIWGGLQQPIRLIARAGLAVTDRVGITGDELAKAYRADVDPLELAWQFSRYKASPAVTITRELITRKTMVGEPVTPTLTALRTITPMWWEDVLDAWRLENPGMAIFVGGLTVIGVGATTYEDSETQTRRRIRQMLKENNYIGADQLKIEWNMENPDNQIVKVSIK